MKNKDIQNVPTVRCKDCKWWDGRYCTAYRFSEWRNPVCYPDDFCSYGVRKGEQDG